ncbi:hypothetical protein NI389_02780 [Pseudoalteromonas xiamenensis]|uniref:hypothetical protein n=1 Tax=Pseudoalteromonas xiamenensis TaxID=882626 RepID=UPI0027E4D756|nr:hypothetical protein [Pseudoalteromonas xiamenensis]WMN60355.1 hypothetical protein NI389_02780 [Pseudoalteromonas xiamenensis]
MMKYLPIILGLTLAGCSSMEYPVPLKTTLDNNHILTTTSGQGQIYVLTPESNYYLCSLPQPDSAFDQKDDGDLTISLINTQGEGSDIDESSEEVELAGRTPAVLLTRELFFRACEFSSNYKLTKEEAKLIYMKTLEGVLGNWKIEAHKTNVNIGDVVNNRTAVSSESGERVLKNSQVDQSSETPAPATDPNSTPSSLNSGGY